MLNFGLDKARDKVDERQKISFFDKDSSIAAISKRFFLEISLDEM